MDLFTLKTLVKIVIIISLKGYDLVRVVGLAGCLRTSPLPHNWRPSNFTIYLQIYKFIYNYPENEIAIVKGILKLAFFKYITRII